MRMTNGAGMSASAKKNPSGRNPRGAAIVGERTVWWSLAGLMLGATSGWFLGYAFGFGWLGIDAPALLASGGRGIPAFVFAAALGAALALAGAIAGTLAEARTASRESEKTNHLARANKEMESGARRLIDLLPIYGSMLLVVVMCFVLYTIASRALGSGQPSDQANRVTWNQKNASRVGSLRDSETALYVLQTAYPATRPENSPGVYVQLGDDWRSALAATSLIAWPLNAALIPPQRATAYPVGPGAWTASISPPSGDPAIAAETIDSMRAVRVGNLSRNVIVVSSADDARWALPAGPYAARTGTPILFVDRGRIPAATAAALRRRGGRARIFVLGPAKVIADAMLKQLGKYGEVTRVSGADYTANAVSFAGFHDDRADFGWGHTAIGLRRRSVVNTILVNGSDWLDGVMAAHLARTGKSGPLLFAERDHLPEATDRYLWRQRPLFAGTPAEGPFNHVWIVGSFDRIGYLPQAWADYSQEIEQYMTLGDSAVSGFEALGIGWLVFSIAAAFWVLFHSLKRLPQVMPVMKAAWTLFALLLGPLAAWLYVRSYNRRERMASKDGMVMWDRPLFAQAVSATVMMFAFDMMLMVVAVFLLAAAGFPIIRITNPLSWMGSAMFLMMLLMFVVALVVMALVFHTPMTMHERKIDSYGRALLVGLPLMALTMTVESLGMMPAMWWAQMSFLPGMQMPTGDDFSMWATLVMAAMAGFAAVLPFNYWLVKRGARMGMM